jgi:hypothetical protein
MRPTDPWTMLAARTTRMLLERTTRIVQVIPEAHGTSQASVSGALRQPFRGSAEFSGPPRAEASGIQLHLADRTGASAIDLIYRGPTLPLGVSPVGEQGTPDAGGDWVAMYSTSDGEDLSELFFAVSGEVRIHPLAGGHLGGQFAFKATSGARREAGDRIVTVAGYFCARQSTAAMPLTAGRLTWDWDFRGLGLDEAELGFN